MRYNGMGLLKQFGKVIFNFEEMFVVFEYKF